MRLTPRVPRRADRTPVRELRITEVTGHLTFTPDTVTAWYRLPEHNWAFRPDPEREALLATIAEQVAGLAGLRMHLRRTTHPFPIGQWATRMHTNATPIPGGDAWMQHLDAAAGHLTAGNHTVGHTMLGVVFARRSVGDLAAQWLRRRTGKTSDGSAEQERLAKRVARFSETLAAPGLNAQPASPEELAWLLYRSTGLGLTPPRRPGGNLTRDDILALTEHVDRYRTPYGTTTRLVNRTTGEETHVAVLTVGRMEPLEIPQVHQPWLHLADQVPYGVEVSSRVDVLTPAASRGSLERRLLTIRHQQGDYAEHGLDAPLELERAAGHALEIEDQISTGRPADSTRIHGWHRLAVTAPTLDECMERVAEVTRLYSTQAHIDLYHPKDQDRLAREFIPGEPIANTGYLRRMPVRLFAAALPQAAATVGDGHGDLIGHTAGAGRRPVLLDLHFPMEVRERSGLAVFAAEPGGGKSTLIGALGYLAARRGVQVTLLDPSGPLARLADMPALRGHARVINLAGAERGTLAPYALVPDPRRADYSDGTKGDDEYTQAVAFARAERRELALDIVRMLLPPQVANDADITIALYDAVRSVAPTADASLDDVVDALDEAGDCGNVAAKNVAGLLNDAAELPLARLFFGTPPPTALAAADVPLLVITMAGLRLPDMTMAREHWSKPEALALPMLYAAQWYAARRCYGGDMGRRKLLGLDEAHFMQAWASGRSFLVRLARDSRKWNLAALVASQNPRDILGLDVQNLVSTVFVGRIAEDEQVAAEALRLLRIPTGVGYEQTLAALSQVDASSSARLGYREFLLRDVDGRVQKIRVDVSWAAGLLEHLNTTPGGTR